MNEKVTAFLPCRAGSQRVVKKNIKPISKYENGLIQIKLKQLINSSFIDRIVLSTDDSEILNYADSLNESRIIIHERVDSLSSSSTSTDELVEHALTLIPEGNILWTHVTSPFISSSHYDSSIKMYFSQCKNGFDSLMSITSIRSFLWKNNIPINYNREKEKWPRTQTLEPIQEVNSGIFLASTDIYKEFNDRIGSYPYLYELDKLVSFDIDWPEDFSIAECLLDKELVAI